MSNHIAVAIIGAGNMAGEYTKVLQANQIEPMVIGRGKENAEAFEEKYRNKPYIGGIEVAYDNLPQAPECAIVAVGVEALADTTKYLLHKGVKRILVEKPAGMNGEEIEEIMALAKEQNAKVYVAYNRRFYSSVEKAREMIEEDGGVTSFHFEFTEWSHVIEPLQKAPGVKENWFLANSTHVVDLAFFLGGEPEQFASFTKGSLPWHKNCIYAGAGITEGQALFTYQANWAAPGRWAIEVLTKAHRFYFKPMEALSIQNVGSVAVAPVEIDNHLDTEFKPGLYKMTMAFLEDTIDERFVTIDEQLKHMDIFASINR